MSSLLHLQRTLQRGVLANDVQLAVSTIAASQGAPAVERLGVYVHAYRTRLVGVLRDDFSGLLALVGAEPFDELARAYIEENPSRERNVRWYGAALAEFLRMTPPWCETPALAEMARLDWTLGLSFDAPDEEPIGDEALVAVAPHHWPTMRLTLCASVYRLRFEWNVAPIRRAADRGDSPIELSHFPSARPWVVARRGTKVFHRELENDEAAALETIAGGGSFADVCEHLCEWHEIDAVALRAVELLKQWVASGWIAALDADAVEAAPADTRRASCAYPPQF